MKLEHSFEVQAPLERVWAALIDVEYVAPCLPGAAIHERDDDGNYHGSFSVKLGPTTAAYNGVLHVGEVDESVHRATLHARGTDKRGQGGATATIVNTVTEAGSDRTRVEAVTDFTITGRLARFGRGGMIEDISNRLLRDFADCLAGKLTADGAQASGGGAAASGTGGVESGPGATGALTPGAGPETTTGAPTPGAGPEATEPATPTASMPPPSVPPPSSPTPPRSAQPAKPVSGFALFFSVVWERIKKRVRAMRKAR